MAELVIGGKERQHVVIRLLSRSVPEAEDYWDGNWLHARIELAVSAWRGAYDADLRADEFIDFREQLEAMHICLFGKARFKSMRNGVTFLPVPKRMAIYGEALEERLRHVRFLGGGTGAGKSTVARHLAAKHGLQLYDAEQFSRYARRAAPDSAPLLHAFMAMDMDERWLNRSPEVMVETFHGFQGELFDLILGDLFVLPERPILAEGFTLLPRLVAPLLSGPHQAVWLAPTPEFQRLAGDSRGSTWEIPRKTSNPELTLRKLRIRDRLFTDAVRREAEALGLPVITVDGDLSVDQLVERIGRALDLSL